MYDKVKQTVMLATDRPFVLRQAIQAIRKGGTLSIRGGYGGYGGAIDKVNFGAAFGKAIHMGMGQTHMHKYRKPLLKTIEGRQDRPQLPHLAPHRHRRGSRTCTRSGATKRIRSRRS